MPNIQLKNDVLRWIDIKTLGVSGEFEPAPPGDVDTVVSGDPTLYGAVVGINPKTNNTAVGINALIVATIKGPALPFVISDSAGLVAFTSDQIHIVVDITPHAVGLDMTSTDDVPQPPPTAVDPRP